MKISIYNRYVYIYMVIGAYSLVNVAFLPGEDVRCEPNLTLQSSVIRFKAPIKFSYKETRRGVSDRSLFYFIC